MVSCSSAGPTSGGRSSSSSVGPSARAYPPGCAASMQTPPWQGPIAAPKSWRSSTGLHGANNPGVGPREGQLERVGLLTGRFGFAFDGRWLQQRHRREVLGRKASPRPLDTSRVGARGDGRFRLALGNLGRQIDANVLRSQSAAHLHRNHPGRCCRCRIGPFTAGTGALHTGLLPGLRGQILADVARSQRGAHRNKRLITPLSVGAGRVGSRHTDIGRIRLRRPASRLAVELADARPLKAALIGARRGRHWSEVKNIGIIPAAFVPVGPASSRPCQARLVACAARSAPM
eukprot:scaffold7282_cov113-Isochrysis_galbana.AAC.5